MASALAGFDPTYSGYLDWRELLLALATASLPAVHTATAAQVAAQALRLAAADGDQDGCLTRQELGGVGWWFAPRQELVEEAEAEPETHVDVLHEVARCVCSQTVGRKVHDIPVACAGLQRLATVRPSLWCSGFASARLGVKRGQTLMRRAACVCQHLC
jgi:hypothetical protein